MALDIARVYTHLERTDRDTWSVIVRAYSVLWVWRSSDQSD